MNRGSTTSQTSTSPTRRGSGLGGVFRGWWIVVGAVVGQFVEMGTGGSIAGVFLRPLPAMK